MGTTGLAAQAKGAQDKRGLTLHLFRGVLLGLVVGLILILFQHNLGQFAFSLTQAESDVENLANIYMKTRLWGAPATLAGYALVGWFIGLGRTVTVMVVQVCFNLVNIALSVWFVLGLNWGIYGVGLASALADWAAFALAGGCALFVLKREGTFFSIHELMNMGAFKKLFVLNSALLIRTLALMTGFAWFINAGAREGSLTLAANHLLLQFITLAAYALDAFANVAEAETGQAVGAQDRRAFFRAVWLTSVFAFCSALFASLLIMWKGGMFLAWLAAGDPEIATQAQRFLPYCALAPVLGVAAYQLDGFFIGAVRSKALALASVAALGLYILVHNFLAPRFGNTGVWSAFLVYYIARAASLMVFWPSLLKHVVRDRNRAKAE